MSEFIKEFGKTNFIILLAIVAVIVVVLIIIVFLEKRSSKKIINQELLNIENNTQKVSHVKNRTYETVKTVEPNINEPIESLEVLEDEPKEETVMPTRGEVYYESNQSTVEEAKEKLEEVTKRLIDEDPSDLIDHTTFETEQEEKSIISYDELIKAAHDIDQRNDKLLEDEGEAAITIEELYRKHADEQNIIEDIPSLEAKVNNPVFEDEPKKFKNSEVISPVFGIYSGKLKPKTALKEIDKTVGQKDLEDEIQRTEDFLSELKKLKNKLD